MEAPSGRGHGKSVEGGKAVGRRVKLPRGARRPFRVFINGQDQKEGVDYTLHEGKIVFRDPIMKEDLSQLGPIRKLVLGLGMVGSYQRDETVDIEYGLGSRREFASNLAVLPD